MTDTPTHNVQFTPVHTGNDRVTWDINVRPAAERGRPRVPAITVRMTVTEDDVRDELGSFAVLYSVRDHRYLSARARDALIQAIAAPWSDRETRTIHPRVSVTDLRDGLIE